MIDLQILRDDKEFKKYRQSVLDRGLKSWPAEKLDQVVVLDGERRKYITEVEDLRAQQKKASKEIAKLAGDDKQARIDQMQKMSKQIESHQQALAGIEKDFQAMLADLPNSNHQSVPVGKNDQENKIIEEIGKKPSFDFKPLTHVDLGEKLGILDFKRAAKVSGTKFAYLAGDAVLLEMALMRWVMDKLADKGYQPLLTPHLVNRQAMYGSGFLPADANEIYQVNPQDDKLYLIGTSEVTILGYHTKETIDVSERPQQYCAFTSCYRREAGAYGKENLGLFRLHQFDKVEMFKFTNQENSWEEYEDLLATAEELVQELGIPYQKVLMCTGDLAAPNAKKVDLEAWLPGMNKFGEIASISNDTDFQARRLSIKYKDKEGQKQFVHTMNGTAVAMGRMMLAIMENYQTKDGLIEVPKTLRKIVGKKILGK